MHVCIIVPCTKIVLTTSLCSILTYSNTCTYHYTGYNLLLMVNKCLQVFRHILICRFSCLCNCVWYYFGVVNLVNWHQFVPFYNGSGKDIAYQSLTYHCIIMKHAYLYIVFCLNTCRKAFDVDKQFHELCRILVDPQRPMNNKVKLAWLDYLNELLPSMEASDFTEDISYFQHQYTFHHLYCIAILL